MVVPGDDAARALILEVFVYRLLLPVSSRTYLKLTCGSVVRAKAYLLVVMDPWIMCRQPGNLQNATLLFDVLTRRKITRIAIWHCGSVGCYSPWFGAALRAWTNSSYAALAP